MLDELKNYLNISWQDELIDNKLTQLVNESKAVLNHLMGVNLDYEQDQEAKELLFNRVRYAYNNALDEFEKNFAQVILRKQLIVGIRHEA
jgi:hypothetical protein